MLVNSVNNTIEPGYSAVILRSWYKINVLFKRLHTLHVHNSGSYVFHEHIYKEVAYSCSGTHDTQEVYGSRSHDAQEESWLR